MIIYKILENGYFGGSVTVPDSTKGIPLWHTRTIPPNPEEGKYILWSGNQWMITEVPPPVLIDPIATQEYAIEEVIVQDVNNAEQYIDLTQPSDL